MTDDTFRKHTRSLTSPPEHAAEITPSDLDDLPFATRALYIGGQGDVAVRMQAGDVVTLNNLQPGTLIPLRVVQVRASGTSASGIVGLW